LEEDVVKPLKGRAETNKGSLKAKARVVTAKALGEGRKPDLRSRAERIAAMTPKRNQSDSTILLRHDRRR
jgi:hypothetical protein